MDTDICIDCEDEYDTGEFMICECGEGPFCGACWEDHKAVCHHAQEM